MLWVDPPEVVLKFLDAHVIFVSHPAHSTLVKSLGQTNINRRRITYNSFKGDVVLVLNVLLPTIGKG